MKERRQLCNKHHLKLRLKKRKSHQLCLPNASKDRFVILNVNFSVVNLVEATLLTSCNPSKTDRLGKG
jgi:hypothetical protein